MAVVSMKELLETGVHFGHRTPRWNPKMAPYIFTERKGVHIIDLQQTVVAIEEVNELVQDTVADGGTIIFVGTKRQAQETIAQEAQRCNMPYVNLRWLGGTLTNWKTIRQRIDYLLNLEARRDRGDFERLTKKEALDIERQIDKLNTRLGGIKEMRELPDLVFVVDILQEETAVKEANKLKIPVIALVDTNCNPEMVDYVIPANDDAIRATRLITSKISDAVLAGINRQKTHEPETYEAEEVSVEDEKYLSAATLTRLKELSFTEEEENQATETKVTPIEEAEEDIKEAKEIEEAQETKETKEEQKHPKDESKTKPANTEEKQSAE